MLDIPKYILFMFETNLMQSETNLMQSAKVFFFWSKGGGVIMEERAKI